MPLSYEQEQAQKEALYKIGKNLESPEDPQPGSDGAGENGIVITGIKLPFSNVFTLALQIAIAAVPATFLACAIWWFFAGFFIRH